MTNDAYTLEKLLGQRHYERWIIAFSVFLFVPIIVRAGTFSIAIQLLLISVCFSATILYLLMVYRLKQKQIDEILNRMEFSLLDFEDHDVRALVEDKLTRLFGNIPERITSNSEMARTRGGDEKGPTWGKQDAKLGEVSDYRDAIEHGKIFDGLEDELTDSEKMLHSANENYSKMAQQRWEESQRNDADLIEAGVETLAELVTTDFFEKNHKDGAVEDLMRENSD